MEEILRKLRGKKGWRPSYDSIPQSCQRNERCGCQTDKTKEFTSKQSRFKHLPEAGRSNGLLIAPSFVGKTTWLQSWLLDWYRGVYARIYVFSPNALTDEWKPIREYCSKQLGVDLEKEQCFFEDMDEAALNQILIPSLP